jgi:uncharacterized protein
MIKLKRRVLLVSLIGLTAMVGPSQGPASDYVSPSQAGPHGKAPGMKVQLLSQGEQRREFAVIFAKGDEAFSGMQAFAEKYQVTAAHFTAIGGIDRGTLAWFDPQRKMFKKIPIDGAHEVTAMIGDIALYQGKPVVHTHAVVAGPDGSTLSGHVLDMYVSPTLEVMVVVDTLVLRKKLDPETGLTLIDPGAQ